MKKTKFAVEIFKEGYDSADLIKIVTNHNAGIVTASLEEIKGYLTVRKCIYPTITLSTFKSPENEPYTILISDNNGEYLSITECTLEELVMDESILN